MPGRNGTASGDEYRYGFNGMEKDDEVKGAGNSLDFGARIYDSRLGRWSSVDPLQFKFPGLSPYNFVANSPLQYIDPDGRDIEFSSARGARQTARLYKKFFGGKVKMSRRGNVITAVSLKAGSTLTKEQQAAFDTLLKIANEDDTNTKIKLVSGSEKNEVLGGRKTEVGDGQPQRIDLQDFETLEEEFGISVVGSVTHEMEEAFQIQVNEIGFDEGAHAEGQKVQAEIDGKQSIEINQMSGAGDKIRSGIWFIKQVDNKGNKKEELIKVENGDFKEKL